MKKSITKRVKITGGGKATRRTMGQDHFRQKRSHKSKQAQRQRVGFHKADIKAIQVEITRI